MEDTYDFEPKPAEAVCKEDIYTGRGVGVKQESSSSSEEDEEKVEPEYVDEYGEEDVASNRAYVKTKKVG